MQEVGIIPLHYQVNIWGMQQGLTYTARTDGYTLAYDVHTVK
jgi:peptide/nickel transport system substrate-binding protein